VSAVSGDLGHLRAEGAVEAEPDRQRQEVAEGERRLVERAVEGVGDALREGRLRLFEAREGLVETLARLLVVLTELDLHVGQRAQRELRIRSDGTDGGSANPHGAN